MSIEMKRGNVDLARSDSPAGNHLCNLTTLSLVSIVLLSLILRLGYAFLAPFHVDEYATVYATQIIMERGIPLLPSGFVYTHGLPLSYLSVPFAALAHHSTTYAELLYRIPSLLLSVIAIIAIYYVGRETFSSGAGLVGAFMWAIYPEAVEWGARIRMYALLQILAVFVIFSLQQAIVTRKPGHWLRFIVLFSIGMLTHLEFALILPALILGWVILDGWQGICSKSALFTLGLLCCAILLPLVLESMGPARLLNRGDGLGVSAALENFVGVPDLAHLRWYVDYLLSGPQLYWVLPFFLAILTVLCITVWDGLQDKRFGPWILRGNVSRKVIFWGVSYVCVMLVFMLVVSWGPSERFLLFTIPVAIVPGAWLIDLLIKGLLNWLGYEGIDYVKGRTIRWRGLRAGALALVAVSWPFGIATVLNSWDVWREIPTEPDYTAAVRYVTAHAADSDIIMSVSVASNVYGGRLDFFPLESNYRNAVSVNQQGTLVHVLSGGEWIGTTREFARVLQEHSVVWFVVDDYRFKSRYSTETTRLVDMNMALMRYIGGVRVYLWQNPSVNDDVRNVPAEVAAKRYIAQARPDIVEYYGSQGWSCKDIEGIVDDWLQMTDDHSVVQLARRRDAVSVAIALGWGGLGEGTPPLAIDHASEAWLDARTRICPR